MVIASRTSIWYNSIRWLEYFMLHCCCSVVATLLLLLGGYCLCYLVCCCYFCFVYCYSVGCYIRTVATCCYHLLLSGPFLLCLLLLFALAPGWMYVVGIVLQGVVLEVMSSLFISAGHISHHWLHSSLLWIHTVCLCQ